MRFSRIDRHHWQSPEGFRITLNLVNDVEKYTAWAPVSVTQTNGKKRTEYEPLMMALSFNACVLKCEQRHHGKTQIDVLRERLTSKAPAKNGT